MFSCFGVEHSNTYRELGSETATSARNVVSRSIVSAMYTSLPAMKLATSTSNTAAPNWRSSSAISTAKL
jgi:hypothetical protein